MNDELRIWVCPVDNTYNSGRFCIRCGRRKPESEESAAAQAEPKDEKQEGPPPLSTAEKPKAETAPAGDSKSRKASDSLKTNKPAIAPAAVIGDKLGEWLGDIGAKLSRNELIRDLKTDRKKRTIAIAALVGALILLYVLFGLLAAPRMGFCMLGHRWSEADCTRPMTCTVCGKEKGETALHEMLPADCLSPATCAFCGLEDGEALGHDWQSATCSAPETCSRCGEHNGEELGHIPGTTRIITPPTVTEPGEEEILCRVCGEAMGTQACELKSYIDGSGFVFPVLDYSKLLIRSEEKLLPELNRLIYKDKLDCDCFAFWLGTEAAATEMVVSCKLYDENMELILITEENYGTKPYAVRWSFAKAWDQETIKTLMPFILSTFSPTPIDGETLLAEKDMTVDGLRYIYENNGTVCRLTVLTTEACSFDTVGKLFD